MDARAHHDKMGRPIELAPIQGLLEAIRARLKPVQIWLFGSRARGDAGAASDWDVLVVVPDHAPDSELDPLVGWRLRKDAHARADVLVCRASDFNEDRNTPNTLAYDAALHGVLIDER